MAKAVLTFEDGKDDIRATLDFDPDVTSPDALTPAQMYGIIAFQAAMEAGTNPSPLASESPGS